MRAYIVWQRPPFIESATRSEDTIPVKVALWLILSALPPNRFCNDARIEGASAVAPILIVLTTCSRLGRPGMYILSA